jgi:hypothetical protein
LEEPNKTWAIKLFDHDYLALINVKPWRTIGQWDTFIPYYTSDCDAYSRVVMNGFTKDHVSAGRIFDVRDVVTDPESKFFPLATDSSKLVNSARYRKLFLELESMETDELTNGRNTWQDREKGGRGEPWTYDPEGFQKMWWDTSESGAQLFIKKWGKRECSLHEVGLTLSDMWKTEYQESLPFGESKPEMTAEGRGKTPHG